MTDVLLRPGGKVSAIAMEMLVGRWKNCTKNVITNSLYLIIITMQAAAVRGDINGYPSRAK